MTWASINCAVVPILSATDPELLKNVFHPTFLKLSHWRLPQN